MYVPLPLTSSMLAISSPKDQSDELPPIPEIWWCEAQLASNPDISGIGVGHPNARLVMKLNLTIAWPTGNHSFLLPGLPRRRNWCLHVLCLRTLVTPKILPRSRPLAHHPHPAPPWYPITRGRYSPHQSNPRSNDGGYDSPNV